MCFVINLPVSIIIPCQAPVTTGQRDDAGQCHPICAEQAKNRGRTVRGLFVHSQEQSGLECVKG